MPRQPTMSAGTMASVSGRRMMMRVPWPSRLSSSTWPPNFSMLVLTTSIPTPRPEMSLTAAAVENPAAKMSWSASESVIRDAWSAVMMPFSMALDLSRSGSMPPPSSRTSICTRPARWAAESRMVPQDFLPLATRFAGDSMPWSTLLRTRWVSGSERPSRSVRSSSTSSPKISSWISFSSLWLKSWTMRVNFPKSPPTGCKRARMIVSCRFEVTELISWTTDCISESPEAVSERPAMRSRRFRPRTISPARFMRESSRPTLMRMVSSGLRRADGMGFGSIVVGVGPVTAGERGACVATADGAGTRLLVSGWGWDFAAMTGAAGPLVGGGLVFTHSPSLLESTSRMFSSESPRSPHRMKGSSTVT